MEKKKIECYRVWCKDGSACLVDAESKEDAKKKAKMLHPFHPYPISKVELLITR
jgi:hypothetical protein